MTIGSSPIHHSRRSDGRPCSPVSGLKYSQSLPLKLRSHSSGLCGWSATTEIYTLSLHDALPIYDWLYFNPETGEQGLPSDRLLWWIGDEPMVTVDGGKKANVTFSLNNSEMNAIRLAS